jgi:tetratricopeptide (TPR) repeat protein
VLADLDVRSGHFQSAIDNLEMLLGKGAKEPALYLLLGSAYLGKKDFVKAGAALQKYLEKNPEDARGKYLYGLALRGQGKHEQSVSYFEDSLKASPPIRDSLAQLVSIDVAQKNFDSALKRIKNQIEASVDDPQLYLLLGSVHEMRKEMGQAETAYLKAIEIDPKFVQANMNLARIYAANQELDKALARLNEVIKMDPKNINALMLSGTLHQRINDIPRAREEYEEVVALSPGFALAANNLAYIYSEYVEDYDKALRMAEMARQSAPNDPNIADTLGWVLYKRNKFEMALNYLKESTAKLPDNTEIQFHLGMIQYRLGNYDEAKLILNHILESKGKFEGALEARRVLDEMMRKNTER